MRLIIVASILSAFTPALRAADAAPDFTTEVRPILSRYCFKCHGPDDKARKAELRLDVREAALKPAESGEPAIVPGKAEKSEFVKRITTTDEDDVMPPKATKMEMSAAQKDILRRWVAAGAEYKQHWAFVAPKRPAVPVTKTASKNPLDAFLSTRLEKESLALSAETDAATLCRRMYLDLIGLPPTPEEIAAFEKDAAGGMEAAAGRLADKLLAMPQYGERWARKWLDLARYADTNGYEKDRERSIWPYRDWVINAINADMPYDQFTIEQVAGDMLPNATPQQRVATGFHRNTMLNEEGGIDPLEFRFHAMTDRVATTGAVWLGLTIGCAQCHTHKYDPILHREYYGVMAFLDNADEPELDLGSADAARKANADRAEKLIAALPEKFPAVNGKSPRESAEAAFGDWLKRERENGLPWKALRPAEAKSNLPLLTPQPDASIFASGDISKSDTYELVFRDVPAGTTALRLEALPDDRLPAHGPGMGYYEGPRGDFFMGEFQAEANGQPLKFAQATESYAKNNFGSSASAKLATDGDPQTGWSCAGRMGEAHEAVFVLEKPLAAAATVKVKMMFGRHYACSLGRFRISATGAAKAAARAMPDDVSRLLTVPEAQLTAEQREKLRRYFLLTESKADKEVKEIRGLLAQVRGTTTLVLRERPPENPRKTFLRHRGEYMQPEEQVSPIVPAFLNPLPKDAPRNRLTFARWLVSRDNPLTARVAVNRQWAAFFGRGFVKTTEDFGFQSEAPTHPELLDWLAVEFMDTGWSFKKLDRLIVTSAAYRQASRVLPEHLAKDPENRLLARFPRTRLEAEIIRDGALRASGLLSNAIGGPSVRPAQAEGVTEVAYGSPKWNADGAPARYRRSLYTYAKRTAPFALYNTFDAPTGEACVARRDVSNTPLQALSVLNDVVFVEASRALGKVIASLGGDNAARLEAAYSRVLARKPSKEESELMQKYFEAQRARFAAKELDAAKFLGDAKDATAETAAWTAVARTLLNLDEAVSKR